MRQNESRMTTISDFGGTVKVQVADEIKTKISKNEINNLSEIFLKKHTQLNGWFPTEEIK